MYAYTRVHKYQRLYVHLRTPLVVQRYLYRNLTEEKLMTLPFEVKRFHVFGREIFMYLACMDTSTSATTAVNDVVTTTIDSKS